MLFIIQRWNRMENVTAGSAISSPLRMTFISFSICTSLHIRPFVKNYLFLPNSVIKTMDHQRQRWLYSAVFMKEGLDTGVRDSGSKTVGLKLGFTTGLLRSSNLFKQLFPSFQNFRHVTLSYGIPFFIKNVI